MKKFIWKVLRFFRIAAYIQLSYKGILDELGWLKSFNTKQAIDKQGNPIPWCTYSFINFIDHKLSKNLDIFEFGSGNSTIWYAKRVKSILAVEHDKNWVGQLSPKLPENAKIQFVELDKNGFYSKSAASAGKKFHVVIIDGRDRNNCVFNSLEALTPDGVFIFDNSQLKDYETSQNFLKEKGFRRIDFKGLCPSVAHINTTTVFYRPENCLDI